jgi:hypothetical protein
MLAVAESFKENQKLEVFNILGNDFSDRSIRFLGEALAENQKSKLVILKIGRIVCDPPVFERFLTQGL